MNIEEAIKRVQEIKKEYATMDGLKDYVLAIETLLTAYEKEKEENVKLRLQDIPLIEGELKAYKDRVNELKAELEKEKEENKNKDKILRNIRDEFLKYDWKDANPIQTYNQIKNLYESIYCKPYED